MSKLSIRFFRWGIPIALFFLFNGLLLFPEYVFKRSTTTFFPSSRLVSDPIIGDIKLLFIRDNADLFRLIGEIILWTLFVFWISRWKKPKSGKLFATLSYLIFLSYHWYYLVSFKLYGEPPNILNDLVLVQEVLPLFLRELGFFNILTIIGVLLFFILLFWGIYLVIRKTIQLLQDISNKTLYITSAGLGLLLLIWIVGVNWTYNASKDRASWKSLHWITPEIKTSFSSTKSLDIKEAEKAYRSAFSKPMSRKPNIYLFFLESYGSVVQLLKEEGPMYDSLMINLESQLRRADWKVASTYSLAPVIGGRSWLSFTSALTGIDISNHLYFNELLSTQYNFPHLVRYLNHQGYHTYRMKTMSNQKQSTAISYALTDRFYAFDQWIKYDDIPYQGFKYDMLGGIPDQYAINYFEEHILDDDKQPFFFFSINMSSHAPWTTIPPFLENWRLLDSMQKLNALDGTAEKSLDESMRYYLSIEYVLKVMVQFILNKVDDEALVILVGDHQPPGMTFLCEGIMNEFAVPLHIISKNQQMMEGLLQNSFAPSLLLQPERSISMRHLEIYDLILKMMNDG